MPQLLRLLGQGRDQMRMGVAERVDGDAGGKIEIALAVGRDQPYAFAPLKGEVDTAKVGIRCDVTICDVTVAPAAPRYRPRWR